ncbi:MAG: T9SS type A sorting domain-containing protein [bacterium]
MKTKLLILFLLLLAPANKLLVQEIPDCKCSPKYWMEDSTLISNSDNSFLIDTCGIPKWFESCDSTLWYYIKHYYEPYYRCYAKYSWRIKFEVDAIPIPAVGADTTIFVSWEEIDSSFNDIRDGFQSFEQTFGSFSLRKVNPGFGPGDRLSREFELFFTDYNNVQLVTDALNEIQDVIAGFNRTFYFHNSSVHNENNFSYNVISISPNPASEYIEINSGVDSRRQTADGKQEWDIQIFNVYGEQMYNFVGAHCNVPVHIDISNLPVGIYFVKVGNTVKSFVVLR